MMKKDNSEVRGVIARKETDVSASAHGFVLSCGGVVEKRKGGWHG